MSDLDAVRQHSVRATRDVDAVGVDEQKRDVKHDPAHTTGRLSSKVMQ